MNTSRRILMQSAGALTASTLVPRVWAQHAPTGNSPGGIQGGSQGGTQGSTQGATQGRMVVVFLRGAYDGLSALVPYADKDYYAIRPSIAIASPDGTRETALKLSDQWALHPALSPLLPLWQQGVMAAIPCAGLHRPNRSHFDAQYLMEIGLPEKSNAPVGWLNKLAGNMSANANASASANSRAPAAALGVGESNPAILAGQTPVKLIPRGEQAERVGVLANERQRSALMDLYAGNDALSVAFRQGAGSRMQTSQELTNERTMVMQQRALDKDGTPQNTAAQQAQMNAASNGAADPVGLALDAAHLATLMRTDRSLRLGFLSAGGWDTHANQGAATGQLANNLGNLARGLAQLRADFDQPGDVIVVMSEFGRTSAENGTKGTDHGFGNAMWLIGNRVNGGKAHGQWTGLARGNLNENRDLPAHHDYRSALAQVLRGTFAVSDSQLQTLLPGSSWDAQLDGLFKRA